MCKNGSIVNKGNTEPEGICPLLIAPCECDFLKRFMGGDGNISYLNFDESVSEETAKELIEKIKQFFERNRIR